MEHYKEGQYDDDLTKGQYDDDLTVGMDDYDDDEYIDTGGVDLFDYAGDEESPLARLKSIVLSIDWEITDDVLRQFNEELNDLQDIWAGNKVNLIYVQALEKISRYIYKEKSAAHPNAIKLLLTFYANLEKIVSDEELSDRQKKLILREDIEKFEKLKSQIAAATPDVLTRKGPAATPAPAPAEMPPAAMEEEPEEFEESPVEIADDFDEAAASDAIIPPSDEVFGEPGEEDPLLNLKAIVYGIDWEITERDLNNLSREVKRLEQEFITSRVKQIFLQGIGSLGAYINLKRSDAHADAFKLLHSFYSGLETVVRDNLTGQAEKNVLLPEVEKFNAFKAMIAESISPDVMARTQEEADAEAESYEEEIQPAFADMPEEVHGYREEDEEAADEGVDEFFEDEEGGAAADESDTILASEMESRLAGMFEEPDKEAVTSLDAEIALKGVDVETEADDDSEEEPLPEEDGELIPALGAEDIPEEESPAAFADQVDEFFDGGEEEDVVARDIPGVDVEHEADDDSEEEPLPFEEDGEYAPALAKDESEEEPEGAEEPEEEGELDASLDSFFGEPEEDVSETEEFMVEADEEEAETPPSADIDERLTDFFGETEPEIVEESGADALQGVDVETAEDDDSDEEPLLYEEDGEIAPALSVGDEEEEEDFEVAFGEAPVPEETALEEVADEELEEEPAAAPDLDLEEEFDQQFVEEEAELQARTPGEEDIESRFDDLFGEEEEAEEAAAEPLDDEETGAEPLQGVDVETEEDDDSEEEPLPIEDGELAPALAASDEEEIEVEEEAEDADSVSESELDKQFDAFFGGEEEEEPAVAEEVEEDLDEELEAFSEPFDETEFEEIDDEDIEEFPEEAVSFMEEEEEPEKPLPAEEDEVMALLGDDELPEDAFGDFDEDDIPEVTAEELGASIISDEDEVVKTAGDVPPGYPSADELLSEFGEVAGGEESLSELGESEEEVVFEPVDEEELEETAAAHTDEEPEEVSAGDEYDESDYFGTTLLADEPKQRRVAAETLPPEPVETVARMEEEEEKAYVEPLSDKPTEDALSDLRNCIVSLGLEIDDSILGSLNDEIEKLRHAWLDRPAERTFIQLLSTIAGHIERYRYEADAEANRLLLSVFDKLELSALGKADATEIQEAILNETSKVLQWQGRLIDRSTAAKADVAEERIEKEERLEDMSRKVDEIGDHMLMQQVSSVMKAELEQLKSAFHAELQELREEILRRG